MDSSSLFFTEPQLSSEPMSEPEQFFSSADGFCRLYKIDRDGKFRVLKTLKPQFRGNSVYESLLHKEYEIGYSLEHPNICNIIGFNNIEDLGNCIEMEWVDGCTLDKLIEKGPLGKNLEDKIIFELCDALSYVHRKQIIHRDLKPENILITHNGLNVKLIDFGLADSDFHSILKQNAGNRKYASPELLRGEAVDVRSDIYSLGRIIFEMSNRYNRIADKCMRREPEHRYQNIEELREAIEKRSKSHLWTILAMVMLILSVCAGGWLFSRAEQPSAEIRPMLENDTIDNSQNTELESILGRNMNNLEVLDLSANPRIRDLYIDHCSKLDTVYLYPSAELLNLDKDDYTVLVVKNQK